MGTMVLCPLATSAKPALDVVLMTKRPNSTPASKKRNWRILFAKRTGNSRFDKKFFNPERNPVVNHADRIWQEAIERPGANQVQFLRALIECRPFLSRIPDQSLLATPAGWAESYVCATRDANGTYALIYLPTREAVTVNLDAFAGKQVRAWWYNPRTGEATQIGTVLPMRQVSFTPPVDGPDWVLVLDDVAQGFDAPGEV